jgi:hypothetical protein
MVVAGLCWAWAGSSVVARLDTVGASESAVWFALTDQRDEKRAPLFSDMNSLFLPFSLGRGQALTNEKRAPLVGSRTLVCSNHRVEDAVNQAPDQLRELAISVASELAILEHDGSTL